MTPYEAWTGEKPKVDHMRIFGCQAFVHFPKDGRKRLDSKSKKCIFMCYGTTTKGYRLYDPLKKKVVFSQDVIFNEQKCGLEELKQREPKKYVYLEYSDEQADVTNSPEPLMLRRFECERKQTEFYVQRCNVADIKEPTSVRLSEAQANQNWLDAMKKEIDSLHDNKCMGTCRITSRLKGSGKQMGVQDENKCQWVY